MDHEQSLSWPWHATPLSHKEIPTHEWYQSDQQYTYIYIWFTIHESIVILRMLDNEDWDSFLIVEDDLSSYDEKVFRFILIVW